MCGRYVLREVTKLREKLEKLRTRQLALSFPPRYNVAPTQTMPVVVSGPPPELVSMRWGPLFSLAGDRPTLMVNARSETAATKASFRAAIQERRCLVPADGFYEWQRREHAKRPYLFELQGHELFWMAGIHQPASADAPPAFLLLTTHANEIMASIHDRMPVILDGEAATEWIAPGPLSTQRMAALCVPFPSTRMTATPVSPLVNHARNDNPECALPWREAFGTGELALDL